MKYDIASKILINTCRDTILRRLLGLEIDSSVILESLNQETPNIRRSDFLIRVDNGNNDEYLVLLEIQTEWEAEFPKRLLDYRMRTSIERKEKIISCVLLCRPSRKATDLYEDNEVSFRYRLVRLYEIDARQVLDEGLTCLIPFIPLMKEGDKLLKEAEEILASSDYSAGDKADMFTCMAILSGLISRELPKSIVSRRGGIMQDSYAFEVFKEVGLLEGMEKGLVEGMEKGMQLGVEKGLKNGILKAVELGLELKFGLDGLKLMPEINRIEDLNMIKTLCEAVKIASNPDEVRSIYITR